MVNLHKKFVNFSVFYTFCSNVSCRFFIHSLTPFSFSGTVFFSGRSSRKDSVLYIFRNLVYNVIWIRIGSEALS